MGGWGNPEIAMIVDMGALTGRQNDPSLSLQLAQEGAAGHVLELAGVVAPAPSLAQLAGEPRALPSRMLGQQATD